MAKWVNGARLGLVTCALPARPSLVTWVDVGAPLSGATPLRKCAESLGRPHWPHWPHCFGRGRMCARPGRARVYAPRTRAHTTPVRIGGASGATPLYSN